MPIWPFGPLFDGLGDVAMTTNFRVKIDKIGLFTVIHSPGIPQRIAISDLFQLFAGGGITAMPRMLYAGLCHAFVVDFYHAFMCAVWIPLLSRSCHFCLFSILILPFLGILHTVI